jgi:hypothetical protein
MGRSRWDVLYHFVEKRRKSQDVGEDFRRQVEIALGQSRPRLLPPELRTTRGHVTMTATAILSRPDTDRVVCAKLGKSR